MRREILATTTEFSAQNTFRMIQIWLYQVVGIRTSKYGMWEMDQVALEVSTGLIFVEIQLMYMTALFSLASKLLTSSYSYGISATDKRQRLYLSMKNYPLKNPFSCIALNFRRTHMTLLSLAVVALTRSRFSMETLSSNHAIESTAWVEPASPVISVIQVRPLQLAAVTASCAYSIYKRKGDLRMRK